MIWNPTKDYAGAMLFNIGVTGTGAIEKLGIKLTVDGGMNA